MLRELDFKSGIQIHLKYYHMISYKKNGMEGKTQDRGWNEDNCIGL
jgi:hypothetical protein